MTDYPITDYSDAYENGAYIDGAADYPARWQDLAGRFREALASEGRARVDIDYGPGARNKYDLFMPQGTPAGLAVFVHGGYWRRFDKTFWSHLAAGPLAHGLAVAMPSYTLCPEVRVADIVGEVAEAIRAAAGEVEGPIGLTGHSAGGHLVTRMISADSPLDGGVLDRVRTVVSISGVHDLRPIMHTNLNDDLHIDAAEADAESPVLKQPVAGKSVACWVGLDERPEFVRQNRALGEVWRGFQSRVSIVEEEGRHHFSVIEGLTNADHGLTKALAAL